MPGPRERDKHGNLIEGEGSSQANIEQTLDEFEHKIDRVRTLYEQYFMGIEKMEPLVARKECTRIVLGLAQQHIRNTGARFRFHSLQQKWNIYVTYWNRTMREIEAGTYKRDVARLTRRIAREGGELSEDAAAELGLRGRRGRGRPGREDTAKPGEAKPETASAAASSAAGGAAASSSVSAGAAGAASAGRAVQPGQPAGAQGGAGRAAPPPVPGRNPDPSQPILPTAAPTYRLPPIPPGMSEQAMRDVYAKYVAAKRQIGSSETVTYESLASTLSKQTRQILEKHACKNVEYDVQVRDGKVVLRPIAKR